MDFLSFLNSMICAVILSLVTDFLPRVLPSDFARSNPARVLSRIISLSQEDKIPGARGCTPQSCSFRDRYNELKQLGAELFGLSTQSTEYQQEMAKRLLLPFEVLSDDELKFSKAMKLQLFEVERMQLIKRITMMVIDGVIVTVHYPVFPSDSDAVWVVDWLHNN